uniref:Putative secretory peptide-19 n=1 Tax=Pleurobrachia bachei TaxID=34499 RepID=M4H2H9_PLEBA|nr:putative secretory peptide-19 [Pleurobrachia bachei]|eukprot:sb/3476910/
MMKSSLVILLVLLGSSQAIMCNGCVEALSTVECTPTNETCTDGSQVCYSITYNKTVTTDGEATTTTNAKKGCAAAPVSGAASTDATFSLAGDDTTYAIISGTDRIRKHSSLVG